MFFYRPWAGNEGKYPQSPVAGPDFLATQFAQHRWGYAALLLLTLLAGVILNAVFLGSFMCNWFAQKKMPHMVLFVLAIRDLLVALILIPIMVDWYVVHVGAFSSGEMMCRIAAFFDFTLATEYAMILVVFSIILYTRKFPKIEDTFDDPLPMDAIEEMSRHSSRMMASPNQSYPPPQHPAVQQLR